MHVFSFLLFAVCLFGVLNALTGEMTTIGIRAMVNRR